MTRRKRQTLTHAQNHPHRDQRRDPRARRRRRQRRRRRPRRDAPTQRRLPARSIRPPSSHDLRRPVSVKKRAQHQPFLEFIPPEPILHRDDRGRNV